MAKKKKVKKKGSSGAKRHGGGGGGGGAPTAAAWHASQDDRLSSVGLGLRVSDRRGRCLVARRPFRRGELVLQTTPVVQTLLWRYRESRCANCFQRPAAQPEATGLQQCARCHVARYCSRGCQAAHWSRSHRAECSPAGRLAGSEVGTGKIKDELKSEMLALVACLAYAAAAGREAADSRGGASSSGGAPDGGNTTAAAAATAVAVAAPPSSPNAAAAHAEPPEGAARPLRPQEVRPLPYDLVHMHSLEAQKQQCAAMVGFGVEHGLIKPADRGRALAVLKTFACNNFGILDELLTSVAIGVFPVGALLNHSCVANTIVTYVFDGVGQQGVVQRFHANRDIAAGEELTHCFTDVCSTVRARRAELLRDYGFRCDCARCTAPEWLALDRTLTGLNPQTYPAASSMLAGSSTSSSNTSSSSSNNNDSFTRRTSKGRAAGGGGAGGGGEGLSGSAALTAAQRRAVDAELHTAAAWFDRGIRSDDIEEERAYLQRALAVRTRHLHRQNLDVLQCCLALHSACMAQGDFPAAARYLEDVLVRTAVIYGEAHPLRSLRLRTLADLQLMQGRQDQYIASLEAALRGMTIAYGADHEAVRNVAAVIAGRQGQPQQQPRLPATTPVALATDSGGGSGGGGGGGGGGRAGASFSNSVASATALAAVEAEEAAAAARREEEVDWDALEQEQQDEIAAAIASMEFGEAVAE